MSQVNLLSFFIYKYLQGSEPEWVKFQKLLYGETFIDELKNSFYTKEKMAMIKKYDLSLEKDNFSIENIAKAAKLAIIKVANNFAVFEGVFSIEVVSL